MNRDRPSPGPESAAGTAGLALFALVFCARGWLIRAWGSPVPYWDQWDAEALQLIRPWLDGSLHWRDFLAAHNEHRIVLTRLADLALFLINGRWNPWWQLLLNAALHAATAVVLARLFWPALGGRARAVWLSALAVLFCVPAGWQNVLWGFQSQVYFENLLSILALGGLLTAEVFRIRWWFGWLAALIALFALGSGLLAAAVALLIGFCLPLLARTSGSRGGKASPLPFTLRTGLGLAMVAAVVAIGWILRIEVPQHAELRAQSVAQFAMVLVRGLGWPWVDSSWLWPVMQAPLLWFIVRLVRHRNMPDPVERLALGLGLLAALHAAAVAYSRGAGLVEASPLSRYQDALVPGVAANLFLLLRLAPLHRFGRPLALIWAGTLCAGLLTLTTTNLAVHLPFKRARDAASLQQIRAYLATHEPSALTAEPEYTRPHPDPAVVRRVLDDPRLRSVLPAEFLDASATPPGLIRFSPWLTVGTGVWLLLTAIRCVRPAGNPRPPDPPVAQTGRTLR